MFKYEVFSNQKRTAEKVVNSINQDNKIIHLVAPMQSGKTGTIVHLANSMPNLNFMLTSGMMDNQLFNQNSYIAENATENVRAIKVHELLKSPNPKNIINRLSIDVLVLDESHFGVGQESRLDKLLTSIIDQCDGLTVVWVGATGYQLVEAGVAHDTIQMEVSDKYFGVQQMLDLKLVQDNDDFIYLNEVSSKQRIAAGIDVGYSISHEFDQVLSYFKTFKNGLGILRETSRSKAKMLKTAISNKFPHAKIEVAVSGEDQSIQDSINNAKLLCKKERVILIVVGGLSAGVDLGFAKEHTRFVIETRRTSSAVVQGLVGRICGYHSNRSCLVLCDIESVQLQAEYERDFRCINIETLKRIFQDQTTTLATNLKYNARYNANKEYFYGGKVYSVDANNTDAIQPSWFAGYSDKYADCVKNLVTKMLESKGRYRVGKYDQPSKYDRINTIQSGKFRNREEFDAYYKRFDEENFNFTSVFHRFAERIGKNTSNGQKSSKIKVGIFYDNATQKAFVCVRDEEKQSRALSAETNNNTLFIANGTV